MKSIFSFLTAICLMFALIISCSALERYDDPCQTQLSSEIATYQGAYRLTDGLFSSIGWSPSDSNGLLLTQNSSSASVTYCISGANSISFSFYTPFAPFAAPDVDHPQKYSIGYEHSSAVSGGKLQIGNASRIYYSPSTEEMFFSHSGQWYRVIYDMNDYCYRAQAVGSPSGSLTGLFCNLYTSSDGTNYQRIDYSITNVHCAKQDGAAMSFCCQNATASLPQNTKYIRLELTGFGQVPDGNGGRLPYDQNQGVALAQVSFSGSNLMVGSSSTSDSSSQVSQPQSDDSKKENSSSKKPSSTSSKNSDKTSSSSKYDGTGTVIPNSSNSPTPSESNPSNSETTNQPQTANQGSSVKTEIGLPAQDRSANLGYLYMIVCVLIVAGVLVYCRIRKKHPDKEEEKQQTPPKA